MKKSIKFLTLVMLTSLLFIDNIYTVGAVSFSDCDVTGDGAVNSQDIVHELSFLYGAITSNNISKFDVNHNGLISEVDYRCILDYILN